MSTLASNPYGTPTSLSLVSSQEPISHHQVDVTSIPDSPSSRRAIPVDEILEKTRNLNRENTKSESPEIRLSVHDVPHTKLGNAIMPTYNEGELPRSLSVRRTLTSEIHSRFENLREDALVKASNSGAQQRLQETAETVHSSPTLEEPSTNLAQERLHQTSNRSRRTSNAIFDEIESDTESFCERQRMHSAKSQRSCSTASDQHRPPRALPSVRKNRSVGRSTVSPAPESRDGGTGASLDEMANLNSRTDTKSISRGVESERPSSLEESTPEAFNQTNVAQDLRGRSISKSPQNDVTTSNGKLQEKAESPSRGATSGSQILDVRAKKNYFPLDVDHPIKQDLSRARKPDPSTLLDPEARRDSRSHQGDIDEDEAGEQQRKKSARKMEAWQRRADREADAKQIEDEKRRLSEQEVKEQLLADVGGKTPAATKVLDVGAVGAETGQEAQVAEEPLLEKGTKNAKTMHDPYQTERVLLEKAEKAKLEKDGAKQLEIEKSQEQKTPRSAKSTSSAVKTPGSTKRPPRTEAQKQRRIELAAKRKAEQEAKTGFTKSDQTWADRIFQQAAGATNCSSEPIGTDSEEEKRSKKVPRAKSLSRDVQKLKDSSVHRSPSPSNSNRGVGQSHKSLTPIYPSSTVTKSHSNRSDLTSSSPLASRSSAHLDTPLRSAFKHNQTPSALRRSVSFVDERGERIGHRLGDTSDPLMVRPHESSAQPIKSLVDINNELALTTPGALKAPENASVEFTSDSKTAKKPATMKEMVQQKLNVTRDKKLKGRAVDTPISSTPTPKQEIILSSSSGDSDSASSSEDDNESGPIRAGPSAGRKPPLIALRQNSVERFNLRGTPIDPAIEHLRSKNCRSTSLTSSHSNTRLISSSQQNSVSRSPAQAMSETMSVSSASASGSLYESEAGSGSGPGSASDPDSDSLQETISSRGSTPHNIEPSLRGTTDEHLVSKSINTELKASHCDGLSDQVLGQKEASQLSFDTGEANEATDQLQIDLRHSVPSQLAVTSPSSVDPTGPYDKLLNQGLDRSGRLPNGTRPAYFKYPTMSTLTKLAEESKSKDGASAQVASHNAAVLSSYDREPSSSSSDESSSNSDADDDDDGEEGPASPLGSRTSPKTKSGGVPGLRSVLKRKSTKFQRTECMLTCRSCEESPWTVIMDVQCSYIVRVFCKRDTPKCFYSGKEKIHRM